MTSSFSVFTSLVSWSYYHLGTREGKASSHRYHVTVESFVKLSLHGGPLIETISFDKSRLAASLLNGLMISASSSPGTHQFTVPWTFVTWEDEKGRQATMGTNSMAESLAGSREYRGPVVDASRVDTMRMDKT